MDEGARPSYGTLLFDGDCGFCTRAAAVAAGMNPAVRVLPWQHADLDELGVSATEAAGALQYVGPRRAGAGSDAVALFLLDSGRLPALLGRTLLLPGVRGLAQASYRIVAANRHRLPGGTPACVLEPTATAPDAP